MLDEFKAGDKIRHIVVCRVQKIGTSSNGGVFARGTVQDNSVTIPFVCFDSYTVELLRNNLAGPKVFTVYGTIDVNRYANDGSLQLMLQKVEEPLLEDNLEHLLPQGGIDTQKYEARFKALLEKIIDPEIRRLLDEIFAGNLYQSYKTNPAGMRLHHAYIGGLLEHSVDVAELALAMAEKIGDTDKDLVIAASLLHDLGKLKEISQDIGFPYTDEGKLNGHITLGAIMVSEAAARLSPPLAPGRLNAVLHIIISHHGMQEKGSPIVCKTKEAFIVNHADELDSIMNQFRRPDSAGEWQYSKMLGREIMLPSVD